MGEAKRGSAWSAEEDAVLTQMSAEGWENQLIANALPDRSVSAVKSRKGAIGLTDGSDWAEAEDELLKKLYFSNAIYSEIAEALGRQDDGTMKPGPLEKRLHRASIPAEASATSRYPPGCQKENQTATTSKIAASRFNDLDIPGHHRRA